uniref:Fatty acid desaturase domain-containing protein n=1 Tax=Ditylenchus dipsaci TaxID=166011 RepID=A0A915EN69_9BILA
MVLREHKHEDFYIKVDNRWILVDEKLLSSHPGGSAMLTYKNLDATTVFHTFHANSKPAYKMLKDVFVEQEGKVEVPQDLLKIKEDHLVPGVDDVNMGQYNLTEEEVQKMCKSFDQLRFKVRQAGLLNGNTSFFARKFCEAVLLIGLALSLQYNTYYVCSALCMGLAWQQLGWMIHEYCHHQHFKDHDWNDGMSYIVGNLMQGFSSGGGRSSIMSTMLLLMLSAETVTWTCFPLGHKDGESLLIYLIPFQHLYWTLALPLLRLSWLVQSIVFVSQMQNNFYEIYRRRAKVEQLTLAMHWSLVALQYYFLPNFQTRLMYFAISQLFAGFLIGHVVTYNHYSTDKFPHNAKILENYACLQLYTTRNMRSGIFIDWLWGGLNYQIEHHLFPTMPRNNLKAVMPMIKEFCAENNLPYMVDDYFTGWKHEIEQFQKVARVASKLLKKST